MSPISKLVVAVAMMASQFESVDALKLTMRHLNIGYDIAPLVTDESTLPERPADMQLEHAETVGQRHKGLPLDFPSVGEDHHAPTTGKKRNHSAGRGFYLSRVIGALTPRRKTSISGAPSVAAEQSVTESTSSSESSDNGSESSFSA